MEWSNELWLSIIAVGFLIHSIALLFTSIHLLRLGWELSATFKEIRKLWEPE